MRLFIAVNVDDRVRSAAAALGRTLRERIEQGRRRLAPAGASWIAPQNMHLTLRFLGEVDRPTATRLADALAQPIAMSPFELALSGIGVFPPSGRPKVLWIGLAAGASELAAVHREIERRLQPFGFEPEGRPYRGHLTLARFREPASIEVKALVERAAPGEIGRSQVREVVLYESDLSPRGPTYAPLARGSLAGARVGAEDEEGRD